MLITIEQGKANPSVSVLLRLSDALGVGLPALVEPPATTAPKLTRSGTGATLWHGEAGGSGILVAGTEAPNVMELWEWELRPGERHASSGCSPGTREIVQVRSGTLVVSTGGADHRLNPGDTLSFHSDLGFSYACASEVPACFTSAVLQPGVGLPQRSEGIDA